MCNVEQTCSEGTFADCNLSSHDVLHVSERTTCPKCGKKRRYFCADCGTALIADASLLPKVSLPLQIEILQSGAEVPQRSTAQHIPLLAADLARVWRPFPECAKRFRSEVLDGAEDGTVAVLYVLISSTVANHFRDLTSQII